MSRLSDAAKAYWKANHIQSPRLIPEGGEQDHRYHLARYIAKLHAEAPLQNVWEFGCSSGRNLAVLREVLGADALVYLGGIDMNPIAIGVARDNHLGPVSEFILGDEAALDRFADHCIDIIFTVSVLDHIPDPEWRSVYDQLVRVARRRVIMVEPIVPADPVLLCGMAEADFADLGISAAGYSYAHDYIGHDPSISIVRYFPLETQQLPWLRQHLLPDGATDRASASAMTDSPTSLRRRGELIGALIGFLIWLFVVFVLQR